MANFSRALKLSLWTVALLSTSVSAHPQSSKKDDTGAHHQGHRKLLAHGDTCTNSGECTNSDCNPQVQRCDDFWSDALPEVRMNSLCNTNADCRMDGMNTLLWSVCASSGQCKTASGGICENDSACADGLSCEPDGTGVDRCLDVVSTNVPNGGYCFSSDQCAGGRSCNPLVHRCDHRWNDEYPGNRKLVRCNYDSDCNDPNDGLMWSTCNGVCQTPNAGWCSQDYYCAAGFTCDKARRKCVVEVPGSNVPNGEPCSDSSQCATGTQCNPLVMRCDKRWNDNNPDNRKLVQCNFDSQCDSPDGLWGSCPNGICKTTNGLWCSQDYYCGENLSCVNRKCLNNTNMNVEVGGYCADWTQCNTGECTDYTCQEPAIPMRADGTSFNPYEKIADTSTLLVEDVYPNTLPSYPADRYGFLTLTKAAMELSLAVYFDSPDPDKMNFANFDTVEKVSTSTDTASVFYDQSSRTCYMAARGFENLDYNERVNAIRDVLSGTTNRNRMVGLGQGMGCWFEEGVADDAMALYDNGIENLVQTCMDNCVAEFSENECNLVLTGHSQGGAQALVMTAKFVGYSPTTIMFGAPASLNREHFDYCDIINPEQVYNFANFDDVTHGLDLVVSWARDQRKHIGKSFFINKNYKDASKYFDETQDMPLHSVSDLYNFVGYERHLKPHSVTEYKDAVLQLQFGDADGFPERSWCKFDEQCEDNMLCQSNHCGGEKQWSGGPCYEGADCETGSCRSNQCNDGKGWLGSCSYDHNCKSTNCFEGGCW